MKKLIFISFIILAIVQTSTAKPNCANTLDNNSVLALVKKKGLLLQHQHLSETEIKQTPSYQPKISFDENRCEWEVISQQYSTTKKGKCKTTNGCTKVKSLHIIIDAQTQKVIKKFTKTELLPNYE